MRFCGASHHDRAALLPGCRDCFWDDGVLREAVLVVDDDPTMRDVVGSYLENHNFRVSFAADGQAMNRVLTISPST